jgi:hypothetical protein
MTSGPAAMLIPASVIFFLSGFAALAYQVTWQRMLVICSGAGVYPATVVIGPTIGTMWTGWLLLDGLAVTWVPTDRVQRTFLTVFPHAIRLGDVLMGSKDPIRADREAVERRLGDPGLQAYYARAGIDIRELIESALSRGVSYALSDAERAQMTNINTDLHPRDELEIPKLFD